MFSMKLSQVDAPLLVDAVNQGIDSRLEAFTHSTFEWGEHGRLHCEIHDDDMQVMIRRLLESGDENSELLADDIVHVEYDWPYEL